MKIDRDKYENHRSGLPDEIAGNWEEELRLILQHDPDFEKDSVLIGPSVLPDQTISFPDKRLLYRIQSEDDTSIESAAIKSMEGDLNDDAQEDFNRLLAASQQVREDYESLLRTRLKADTSLVFPTKSRLKKRVVKRALYWQLSAVAAILIMIFLVFVQENKVPTLPLASTGDSNKGQKSAQPAYSMPKNNTSEEVKAPVKNQETKVVRKLKTRQVQKQSLPSAPDSRRFAPAFASLPLRSVNLNHNDPISYDLAVVTIPEIIKQPEQEFALSGVLKKTLHRLRGNDSGHLTDKEYFLEAGLRFFSRITGNRVSSRKNSDGHLKNITYNSYFLAVSIPVNE